MEIFISSKETKFRKILSDYGFYLRRIVSTYEGNRQKAKELFHDVCIAIYESLDRFRGESSLKTWVHRVTVNVCCKHVRDALKRPWESEKSGGGLEENAKIDPDKVAKDLPIEEKVDARLMLDYIAKTFSAEDQLIMYLYFMGYTQSEVSDITRLTRDNVAQRISRLKKKIVEHMNKGKD